MKRIFLVNILSDIIVREGTSPLQHIFPKEEGKPELLIDVLCQDMLNEEPVNGTNAESIQQIIKDSYSNPCLQCWKGPHLQDGTIDGATKK